MGGRAESLKHETEPRSGADRGNDLDFAATLLGRAGDASPRKAERTRLRLLAAIAGELSAGVSRSGLTVAAVAARAGLAHGTLYRYFADLDAALAALVEEFARFVLAALSEARAGEAGSRARVRQVTLVYTRLFAANAGLMRYLVGLGGADAGFAEAYRRLNRDWY
ncbi:MAG TPA: TetR family transcriptional regulator, partial [Kaistiaceae bacterium]|nr:TetR family transcriptional regulator [Kaistiaceae bacterium]